MNFLLKDIEQDQVGTHKRESNCSDRRLLDILVVRVPPDAHHHLEDFPMQLGPAIINSGGHRGIQPLDL